MVKRLPLAAGMCFVLVALLAVAVHFGLTIAIDRTLMQGAAPPAALIGIVSAVTWLGDSLTRILVTALAALALLIGRDRRRAVVLVLIVGAGAAVEAGAKALVARPRPDLLPHLDHVTSPSFPSGHAANSAILYLALALLVPARYRRIALLLAAALIVAIGISRVALAVHWPSDVLAGWSLGLGWILLWRNRLAAAEFSRSAG